MGGDEGVGDGGNFLEGRRGLRDYFLQVGMTIFCLVHKSWITGNLLWADCFVSCNFPPIKVGGLVGHCGGGGRDNRWGGQGCNPGDNLKLKACLSNSCCISLSSITICLSLKLLVVTFLKIFKAITGLDLFIPAFIVTHWNSTLLLLLIIKLLFSFENCFPLGEEEHL